MLGSIGAAVSATKTVAGLAAAGKAPDAGGLYTWVTGSPVRLVLAFVAICVIVGANRGKVTKAAITLVVVVIGLFIMTADAPMKDLAAWLGSYA